MDFLSLAVTTVTEGLFYSFLVYGIFITYKILDFPDLTVDGSFPLGAAITALLILRGTNPWITLPVAFLCGAAAGLLTGLIHIRLKVRDLLSGIVMMTALLSVNLVLAGSNQYLTGKDTIFSLFPGTIPLIYKKLIVTLLLSVLVKILIDLFFRTKTGLLLRGTGDNITFVTTLSVDSGKMKILGLSLANGLVALAGCIVCQGNRSYSSQMGTGQMVFGLAAVLIGTTLLRKVSFLKGTTMALIGSILYKICVQIAIQLGLPANLLNLITAVLFLAILTVGNLTGKKEDAHHA